MKAALLLTSSLLPLAAASVEQPGFISFPVKENRLQHDPVAKRQVQAGASPKAGGSVYTVDVKFGTPGQIVKLSVETKRSETFVNVNCAKSSNPGLCASAGRLTLSNSLVDLGAEGGFADHGKSASWEYVYDFLAIGGE